MDTPTAAPSTPSSTSKSRSCCNWSAEERAEWLALFEASGQSVSEFCRANDLPAATLSLWRTQLRGSASAASDGGELIEVPLATRHEAAGRGGSITLRVGEVELAVAVGTDAIWIAELVRALRAA